MTMKEQEREKYNIPHCHFPSTSPVQNLLGPLEGPLGTYKMGISRTLRLTYQHAQNKHLKKMSNKQHGFFISANEQKINTAVVLENRLEALMYR